MFVIRTNKQKFYAGTDYNGPKFTKNRKEAQEFSSKSKANRQKLVLYLDYGLSRTSLIVVEIEDGKETEDENSVRKFVPVQFVALGINMLRFKDYFKKAKIPKVLVYR